jgi:preprotein translocase subunit YajC
MQGNPASSFIFLALMGVLFYFFLIRPQKKRMEAQRALIQSVEEGDEVVTIGGILGTVQTLSEDEMHLEVAPGTQIRILRSAVARKLTEDDEEEEDYEEDDAAAEEDEQA